MSEEQDNAGAAKQKFDTCRFRSNEIERYGESWCCGENVREGFICYELNILDLTPSVCFLCQKYQPRVTDG